MYRRRAARTFAVPAKEIRVGDLIAIGGQVMRVSTVVQLHNGARLRLDTGALLALTTATRITVTRAERPDTASWQGR
jgi:hypothetical protein